MYACLEICICIHYTDMMSEGGALLRGPGGCRGRRGPLRLN